MTIDLERALRGTKAALAPTKTTPDIVRAATEAGLIDIAYATCESPLGELFVASTPRGLVRLAYLDAEFDATLADLAHKLSPRILKAPRKLDEVRRELDQYFEGNRHTFEVPLDWTLTRGFGRRVLQATARIPYGSVSTYAEIAAAAGSPRGSRAAGNALGANPLPIIVPCHRVLRTGGSLGGYTGGLHRKQTLLAVEGAQRTLV
jgi:methylated-DNA-[protein]-cysteine S-methyltransferase